MAADPPGRLAAAGRLPISNWSFRGTGPAVRHLGPTAQDFRAAFGLGSSDARIDAVDAQGVALAAIQGLGQLAQEQDAEIAGLQQVVLEKDAEIAGLREQNGVQQGRLDKLEQQNAALEAWLEAIPARLGAGESR